MNNLSVLITYYNEKALLTECLKSLLNQKNAPEEVLIYDDASQFPASDFIPQDPRVRIVRGETNKGPSFGRNILLKEAKGDYIHFHDADDWFHDNWCEEVRRASENRNADAVFTEIESYDTSGKLYRDRVLGLKEVKDHESLIRFCLRRFMLVPAGTFKTDFVRKNGGYRTDLWQSEDYEFNARMALELGAFEVIQEPLVCIRLREESRSRNRVETNSYALEAVMQLKSEVPRAYWSVLSEKASDIGRQLYQLGERKKARQAFRVAKSLGNPKYENESSFYRWSAKCFGQEIAETLGNLYRKYLPPSVRKRIRKF